MTARRATHRPRARHRVHHVLPDEGRAPLALRDPRAPRPRPARGGHPGPLPRRVHQPRRGRDRPHPAARRPAPQGPAVRRPGHLPRLRATVARRSRLRQRHPDVHPAGPERDGPLHRLGPARGRPGHRPGRGLPGARTGAAAAAVTQASTPGAGHLHRGEVRELGQHDLPGGARRGTDRQEPRQLQARRPPQGRERQAGEAVRDLERRAAHPVLRLGAGRGRTLGDGLGAARPAPDCARASCWGSAGATSTSTSRRCASSVPCTTTRPCPPATGT